MDDVYCEKKKGKANIKVIVAHHRKSIESSITKETQCFIGFEMWFNRFNFKSRIQTRKRIQRTIA